ncbi:MAG: 30S ribosomal protein S8 [Acidimicrobiia bacterium]
MSQTDPIADMLTSIRNANLVYKTEVATPVSKIKLALAALLYKEGYIEGYEIREASPVPLLVIRLKYGDNKERVIHGIRRVSKPGRRVYAKASKLPRVLGGMGVAVISTPKGLMSDRKARSQRLGGEVVCEVW